MEYYHTSSRQTQGDDSLEADLECVRKENQALRFLLEAMTIKYTRLKAQLHRHLQVLQQNKSSTHVHDDAYGQTTTTGSGCSSYDPTTPNKRARTSSAYKFAHHCDHQQPQFPVANKISQFLVRTDSKDNTLNVKDGYQWRKYGQKVTKDNPSSPRAYFRCSMAPTCPVKKRVQRCMQDKSILVATYEGQHNHTMFTSPCTPTPTTCNNSLLQLGQIISSSSSPMNKNRSTSPPSPLEPNITLDLTLTGDERPVLQAGIRSRVIGTTSSSDNKCENERIQEYVTCLTKDPNFTVALAAAVARSLH